MLKDAGSSKPGRKLCTRLQRRAAAPEADASRPPGGLLVAPPGGRCSRCLLLVLEQPEIGGRLRRAAAVLQAEEGRDAAPLFLGKRGDERLERGRHLLELLRARRLGVG